MCAHTSRDARFHTCTYKHTHGRQCTHTNTIHTRETIKVSLAKRNTLYVCSWICTIKCVCVCVCAWEHMFLQKWNGTFWTPVYVHCINVCMRVIVFVYEGVTVCAMCPCPCWNSDMLLSPPGPVLNSPPVVLSAFTILCQETDTRWCPK